MKIDSKTVQAVAARLREAAETGKAIPPIRDELAGGGVDAAYAIQQANTEHALKQGRRLVGRKVGLTSKSVQKQLGVDSPDFGMLFADMELYDGEEVALGRVLQPKAEAEVAFVLRRDLTHPGITLPDLISAVAYALPAVEIVGSRIENWNIKLLDTIADNASSGLYVLGAAGESHFDADLLFPARKAMRHALLLNVVGVRQRNRFGELRDFSCVSGRVIQMRSQCFDVCHDCLPLPTTQTRYVQNRGR